MSPAKDERLPTMSPARRQRFSACQGQTLANFASMMNRRIVAELAPRSCSQLLLIVCRSRADAPVVWDQPEILYHAAMKRFWSRMNCRASLGLSGLAALVAMTPVAALAHPTITLFSPAEDDTFQAGEVIKVEVEAQSGHENVSILSVAVVVDGKEVGSKTQPPYSFELILDGGEHKIKATGLDSEMAPGESDLVYVQIEGSLDTGGAELVDGGDDDAAGDEDAQGTTEGGDGGTDEAAGDDDTGAEPKDDPETEGCSMAPTAAGPWLPWGLSAMFGFAFVARSRRRKAA